MKAYHEELSEINYLVILNNVLLRCGVSFCAVLLTVKQSRKRGAFELDDFGWTGKPSHLGSKGYC